MSFDIPTTIGMCGALLNLVLYFLLQFGKIKSEDFSFSFLNSIGSVCLLISLMYNWNLPTVIIESTWLAVSIYGAVRALFRERKSKTVAMD